MIEKTVNIGLIKEDEDEFYNVSTVNDNLDKIDEEFSRKVNKIEGKIYLLTITQITKKKN